MKHKFAKEVNEHIFPANSKSCADSMMVYDAATGGLPSFRIQELNEFPGATQLVLIAPVAVKGEEEQGPKVEDFLHYVASMGELPEITVPLGQVQYLSPITKQWEYMPVTVQIVTRKGCDGVLYELVRKLGDKGILKAVETGKEAFVEEEKKKD